MGRKGRVFGSVVVAAAIAVALGGLIARSTPRSAYAVDGPDVTVSIAGADEITAGRSANFAVLWTNVGVTSVTGTTQIGLTVPEGVTVTGIAMYATPYDYTFTSATSADGRHVDATYVGPIVTNRYLSMKVQYSVAPQLAAGTVTATVANAGDVNPANNQASFAVPASPTGPLNSTSTTTTPTTSTTTSTTTTTTKPLTAPDAALTMSASGRFRAGRSGRFELKVANAGTASVAGLTVVDTLPAALSFDDADGTGWSCSSAAKTVTCRTSTTVKAGRSAPTLTLSVDVASGTRGQSVTNTAVVTAAGDSRSTNNTASTVVTIQ
jgi:uncharacterized repeat protein (TIGR01451 family)